MPDSQLKSDMQALLIEIEDIFQSPRELPPSRLKDHKIPLVDEGKIARVRPYKYPVVQKDEMEKIIRDEAKWNNQRQP